MAKKTKTACLAAGEMEMMQMLWREGGVTISEARRALDRPIGYTTVQTRLNRLVAKGCCQPRQVAAGEVSSGGGARGGRRPAYRSAAQPSQRGTGRAAGNAPGEGSLVEPRRDRRAKTARCRGGTPSSPKVLSGEDRWMSLPRICLLSWGERPYGWPSRRRSSSCCCG